MFGDVRAMQSAESITPSVATLVAALLPYFKIACNAVILAHKPHDGRVSMVDRAKVAEPLKGYFKAVI